MAGVLRKILRSTSKEKDNDDDDHNSFGYSYAFEYSGPAVPYLVPRAVPVDVKQIPMAAAVASASMFNDVSLPVIHPIVKSNPLSKKLPKESNLGPTTSVRLGTSGVLNGNDCSCERGSSSVVKNCANVDECRTKLGDGTGCSGRLRFQGDCGSSSELSGSLKVLELPLPDDIREGEGGQFQDYMNPSTCESTKSDLSSSTISSEIFSGKEKKDQIEEAPGHVKRPSTVTFRDPESNDVVVQEESELSEAESSIPARPMAVRQGKKGTCYRCLKGNRFAEKEVCIVCGAKYCKNCVVRAMGSMPEGRKCVTCIGQKIDEDRRKSLGKCSWMLKQLLPELEVKQIMNSERLCAVNQLPSQLIYVNRQRLTQEELFLLQTCQHPPKKLKPGNYWYDKVSGFWGKEGQRPCQIITPQLTVGGHIQEDASNGNTNIIINSRRITKVEHLMLQLAGVKCEGATSFWLSADGSYQEEGMNKIKGNMWENTRAKVICALLFLPTPDSVSPNGEEMNGVILNNLKEKTLSKFLLVGSEKCGTSTIFKQAKIVYNVPFSEDERQSIKFIIQSNLYGYLGILLEGCERFEEESLVGKRRHLIDQRSPPGFEIHYVTADNTSPVSNKTIYSVSPRLKAFSDWLLKVMVSGNLETIIPAATGEYAPYVEELWRDAAIQATYNRRSELELLPRVATYFLERAVAIARTDYEPSDMDILHAEGIASSKGLSAMEFSFPTSAEDGCQNIGYQHDPSLRYQLIRVHPRILGGNCKRLELFEDVDIVLFCVSLTDYDEFSKDTNGVTTNKMIASKQLLERIVTNPTFEKKKFLLILNKFDLLKEKIEQVPLTRCEWFHDFNPVIGHNPKSSRVNNPSLALRAFQYVAVKFKKLFHSLTDKKLYVSLAAGLEPHYVDEALKYAREILKWNNEEHNYNYGNNETSSTSTSIDPSSSS